jgi:hypothetical protein
VEQIRAAALQLSGNALKLYLYICFHVDGENGSLEATENDLLQWTSSDRKMLFSAFRELKEKRLCDVEVGRANRRVRIISTRTPGNSSSEQASAPI